MRSIAWRPFEEKCAPSQASPASTARRRRPQVFSAWTDAWRAGSGRGTPRQRRYAPKSGRKVGGRYHIRCKKCRRLGGIRAVVPDRRLVFSWTWHSTPERPSLVSLTLTPGAQGTYSRHCTSRSSNSSRFEAATCHKPQRGRSRANNGKGHRHMAAFLPCHPPSSWPKPARPAPSWCWRSSMYPMLIASPCRRNPGAHRLDQPANLKPRRQRPMKLYYFETLNPRKVCAVARYHHQGGTRRIRTRRSEPGRAQVGGLLGHQSERQGARACRRWRAAMGGERDHALPRQSRRIGALAERPGGPNRADPLAELEQRAFHC